MRSSILSVVGVFVLAQLLAGCAGQQAKSDDGANESANTTGSKTKLEKVKSDKNAALATAAAVASFDPGSLKELFDTRAKILEACVKTLDSLENYQTKLGWSETAISVAGAIFGALGAGVGAVGVAKGFSAASGVTNAYQTAVNDKGISSSQVKQSRSNIISNVKDKMKAFDEVLKSIDPQDQNSIPKKLAELKAALLAADTECLLF